MTRRTAVWARTASTLCENGPKVTTVTVPQSASWKARSSGGSSGFAGLKVAPASSDPTGASG